jgi:tetrathionate reductase subunit B
LKDEKPENPNRRQFIITCSKSLPLVAGMFFFPMSIGEILAQQADSYDPTQHNYAMGVDIHKCIGCARCADACKTENDVPRDPIFFRTWVERYIIKADGEAIVDSPNGGIDGYPESEEASHALRTFFVPKLCNHCANAPCVQVCPVGATFTSRDGVVLVDEKYCVGCRYCIQACPYGARYLHPSKKVADKCTFCYHRITRGLLPACVEVCPTQARIFGEISIQSNPLRHFLRFNDVTVLKSSLNTKPKVYYAGMDGEVR